MVVSTQLKNISQVGSSPQVGMKIKNIWNHHLVSLIFQFPVSYGTWESSQAAAKWLPIFISSNESRDENPWMPNIYEVGGWTNTFAKYARTKFDENLPQLSGWK